MKKIILVFIFLFQFTICHPKETLEIKKLPHKDALIERIYKLDSGNFIYVEQWQRGDIIWEYDIKTNKLDNSSIIKDNLPYNFRNSQEFKSVVKRILRN